MANLIIKNLEKLPPVVPNIYISDVVQYNGATTYKLHVNNIPFNGYINTRAMKGINNKTLSATFNGYGNDIVLNIGAPIAIDIYSSLLTTIPIGVYDCSFECHIRQITSDPYEGECGVSYGYTTTYTNDIAADAYYNSEY